MIYAEEVEIWAHDPIVRRIGHGKLTLKEGMPSLEATDLGLWTTYTPLSFPHVWTLASKAGTSKGRLLQYWNHVRDMHEWVSERERNQ